MTRREDLAKAFLHASGWGDARVTSLAGDASNRRYDRLRKADGSVAVLMDATPEKGEDVRPFIALAEHLRACGLSAPQIFHRDTENGFLVIEDLGDALFARLLAESPDLEKPLYRAAADVLLHLHRTPPPGLPRYDSAVTVPLAGLAYDWYLRFLRPDDHEAAQAVFLSTFAPVIAPFDDAQGVLIQRDYHAENLLWLPQREGVARVGLLDFQDAMIGHPVYDLVSVLQDARRDVSGEVVAATKRHFMQHSGFSEAAFETAYSVFGLQRNLRILGVFARLCLRDNKAHYADLIPRVWSHIETNLAHPAVQEVAEIVRRDLPAPTAAIIANLKEKRGSWAGR